MPLYPLGSQARLSSSLGFGYEDVHDILDYAVLDKILNGNNNAALCRPHSCATCMEESVDMWRARSGIYSSRGV